MPSWPSNLPDYLMIDGAGETYADNTIRSAMETGPAKMRRRSTAAPVLFSGSQTITASQAGDLDTFYKTTLAYGSLSFTWKHPRTRSTATMRFTAPPRLAPREGVMWLAQYQLEILP